MTIDELHDRLFEVLCTIDDICKTEGVDYFLDSGTELGSVRECDFIPWDDDMDLKVLAENYPKFKKAMVEHLPPYMHLIEPQDFTPYFYDFTIRIVDERYRLRPESDEDRHLKNYQNMVGTDIFLFAKAPQRTFGRKIYRAVIKFFYGLGMGHRYKIKYENHSKGEIILIHIIKTIGKLIPLKVLVRRFFTVVKLFENKKTDYRVATNFPFTVKGFDVDYKDEWYKGSSFGTIRGRKFPIPMGYDSELKAHYGNYLIPDHTDGKFIKHLQ